MEGRKRGGVSWKGERGEGVLEHKASFTSCGPSYRGSSSSSLKGLGLEKG